MWGFRQEWIKHFYRIIRIWQSGHCRLHSLQGLFWTPKIKKNAKTDCFWRHKYCVCVFSLANVSWCWCYLWCDGHKSTEVKMRHTTNLTRMNNGCHLILKFLLKVQKKSQNKNSPNFSNWEWKNVLKRVDDDDDDVEAEADDVDVGNKYFYQLFVNWGEHEPPNSNKSWLRPKNIEIIFRN